MKILESLDNFQIMTCINNSLQYSNLHIFYYIFNLLSYLFVIYKVFNQFWTEKFSKFKGGGMKSLEFNIENYINSSNDYLSNNNTN